MMCQRMVPTVENGPGTHAMKRCAIVGTVLLALGGISACTPTLLGSGEREAICRVVVEEQFNAVDIQANPVANPAGGAVFGAGSAALIALGIVALNPIAVIQGAAGVAAGLGCGAAGAAHPNAETDFRKIVVMADRGVLKRALEAEFGAPRPSCRNVPEGATALPDTVIQIDSVVLTMGCPTGRQSYYITVKWRAMSATDRKVLAESTTRCMQVSAQDIDTWSVDGEHACAEVNGALARTAQRIAAELLGADKWAPCEFQPVAPVGTGQR